MKDAQDYSINTETASSGELFSISLYRFLRWFENANSYARWNDREAITLLADG